MSLWRQLAHGLRALAFREATDKDVSDEVQHYLEQATQAHLANGLSLPDAQRAARLEVGNATVVREGVRSSGWEHMVETFVSDVRFGARRLRSAPAFTGITVLTLALGIGGATAIFSAVNPILLQPLPYPDAERLVEIIETGTRGGRSNGTFGMFHELSMRQRSFEALAVIKSWQPTVANLDEPRFEGQKVSAAYFRVLGVTPALGRDFAPSDDQAGSPNVVILSDALWRRRFAADPGIIGQSVRLNEARYTVIAVMPATFENVMGPHADVWAPLQYAMSEGRAWGHHLRTIGRVKTGVGVAAASAEVRATGGAIIKEMRPDTYDEETTLSAASLQDELTRAIRPALLVILGAVAMVLIIACVNVANLLIARGVQRRGEFALRAALGAGHGRIVRQLLTESLLLAAIGGAAGMVVAAIGVKALVALSPADLPRASAIRVDRTVLLFGLLVSVTIGVAFGVFPALQAARSDPHQALKEGASRVAGGHRRMRGMLVVGEVALATMLLVASGLLLRSLQQLFSVPVGFESSGVLTMQVQTNGSQFTDAGASMRYFAAVAEAVRAVPGVVSAGLTSQLPLSGDRDEYGASFDATATQQAQTFSVFRYAVSPGYLETMQLPLRQGRTFTAQDGADAPYVAVISASLARSRFENRDPIGQRLKVGPVGPFTIIGVVGDVKQVSLARDEPDAVYLPTTQWPFNDRTLSLVVRTTGNELSLTASVRDAIRSIDRDQPILRVASMDDLLAASAAERRFSLVLFEVFGIAALLLAAAGIYGVLAGSVTERTREIGVRTALGASRSSIVSLVIRQGMSMTLVGMIIGLAGAVLLSEGMVSMLFGITRLDPTTYAAVAAMLLTVSVIACSVPAWRALRVDPAITLRAE